MIVQNCPHCQNPIEVSDLWEFFDCPSCKASLKIQNEKFQLVKAPQESPKEELPKEESSLSLSINENSEDSSGNLKEEIPKEELPKEESSLSLSVNENSEDSSGNLNEEIPKEELPKEESSLSLSVNENSEDSSGNLNEEIPKEELPKEESSLSLSVNENSEDSSGNLNEEASKEELPKEESSLSLSVNENSEDSSGNLNEELPKEESSLSLSVNENSEDSSYENNHLENFPSNETSHENKTQESASVYSSLKDPFLDKKFEEEPSGTFQSQKQSFEKNPDAIENDSKNEPQQDIRVSYGLNIKVSQENLVKVRQILEDQRLKLNVEDLISQMQEDHLQIENLNPVKVSYLVNRLSQLPVQVTWFQTKLNGET